MYQNSLSDRLQMTVRRITGRGQLNEKDIEQMLREIRLSLLEADVNFRVVRTFTERIKEQALGEKILKGLNPSQQVVKIVHDELVNILGSHTSEINLVKPLTTIMTVGLQGSGKTTAIGKMAVHFRKNENRKVFLIAADIYRPAAIDQLITIGKQIGIEVFSMGLIDPRKIVTEGLKKAKDEGYDLVIIDTAGRLNIDDEMMQELIDVRDIARPNEILLTVDAMMGQEAATVAKSFHDQINTTGAILTKMDGDTRGGAALSIVEISGIPIKFSSYGEKMDTLEVFHPDRVASRILGMGDMLTFIETVTDNIDEDEAKGLMEKMMSNSFNYNDLLKQFKMIKRMGSISKWLGFIPGLGSKLKQATSQIDDKQFDRMAVMINSMTEAERKDPELINRSSKRRVRIANGAGVSVTDVNRLREALDTQKEMMKKLQGFDESDLDSLSKDPSKLMPTNKKARKGKGKGRGNFRF